jgi:MoaA/NifB/PqqE/SkfB family radical SAM enzyme
MNKKSGVENIGRKVKAIDNSFMMIFLLEECNFSCDHCAREDEPMSLGYKLSFKQLKECLKDCQKMNTIEWVHFSGGEPTLWTEGERDLADLLIEMSKEGFTPGFTTNGSNFVDYAKCENFLNRYFDYANKKLRLYFSIDTFHGNFDAVKGRAESLDNVLKYKMNMPSEKGGLLNITVLVTVSKDVTSLLPEAMIEYYESQGIEFKFIPLDFKGKAKSIGHLCPDVESKNPEDMGAYYHFHQKKKEIGEESNLILIDNDYYLYDYDYSIEFLKRWHKVALLGHLAERINQIY